MQRLGRNPNALYILAQTVLVQKYALEQATGADQPAAAAGAGAASSPPTPPASWAACWAPRSCSPRPQPLHPRRVTARLRPALCPALVAGALVWSASAASRGRLKLPAHGRHDRRWRGCGSTCLSGGGVVLHGFGHSAGFGGGVESLAAAVGRPEEIVINNYYDDSGRGLGEGSHERVDNSSYGDSSNDAANLQQASDDLRDDGDDQDDLSLDDTSYDDSSYDDDSSSGDDLA